MIHRRAIQWGRMLTLSMFLVISILTSTSFAIPIVSYSFSGSSNNWTLDFSVTNNLGGSNYIYFFGVGLPVRDITGEPTNWDPDIYKSWENDTYGGSKIIYNNVWMNENPHVEVAHLISDGQTLNGFKVHDTADLIAPTSVDWFAYGKFGYYSGGDNFHNSFNPAFEGIASDPSTPVPEPSTFLLILSGLAWVGFLRRNILLPTDPGDSATRKT